MTEMTAGSATPEALFSAPSARTLRKALEIVGWLVMAMLLWTGLTSIFGRADFLMEASTVEYTDPLETFNAFDGRYVQFSFATWAHLIPGLLIFGLGPLQFSRYIRKNYLNFHRWSGRVWLTCGVISAFSGGFIGIFYPFMGVDGQGFNESMATTFFAVYTLFCMYKAYSSIRAKQFGAHREWMIRSWALMLAIATERVMLGILMGTTGVGVEVLFGTTFWMAGVVNIVASEIWINLTRTPGNGNRHWKDLDAKAAA
ncbi:MAG: DUF2306 domain-containing protein [Pseudomonadales bacterium]|nr:DUF2306 domain-containing protein [Pseudomonadales bacterium]